MSRTAIEVRTTDLGSLLSRLPRRKEPAMRVCSLPERLNGVTRRLASAALLGTLLFCAFAASTAAADLDSDGLDDDWETRTGFSLPFDGDSDQDELRDGQEWTLGTVAMNPDTDGDGPKDGTETYFTYNTNPLDPDSDDDGINDFNDAQPLVPDGVAPAPVDPAPAPDLCAAPGQDVDTDGDGMFDADECGYFNTNPSNPDTDGDGAIDGLEDENDTDPNDPNDF